jgi:thioredoxin 1
MKKKPIVITGLAALAAAGITFLALSQNAPAEGSAKKGGAAPVVLTVDNFDEKTASGVVLVDFWAEWCGPCRTIAPTIKELAVEYEGKALIGKVDVDSNQELAKRFKIQGIPNLKILKDGKVVDEIVGLVPKEAIVAKLDKHLK